MRVSMRRKLNAAKNEARALEGERRERETQDERGMAESARLRIAATLGRELKIFSRNATTRQHSSCDADFSLLVQKDILSCV
mmetsp:Transcript_10891/g.21564  ORF Transcript_10891/g.21564 Transcript_10891/m.21564 type:complete len:82 (+) Transcript_10891:1004-1249(+)